MIRQCFNVKKLALHMIAHVHYGILRSSMSIFSFPEFVGRCFLDKPTQNKLGLTFLALPFKALKPKT